MNPELLLPQQQVTLAKYTSWGIGGPADYLFQPPSVAALQTYLQSRPVTEPLHVLGLGSNVLVPDEGLRGSVIVLHQGLTATEQLAARRFRFAAGVTCAKAARLAVKAGCEVAAFWAGIPGTIGGAVAMNAGCFGHETWDYLVSVQTVDRSGQLRERVPEAYQISYRTVGPPRDEIFVSATFEFPEQVLDNDGQAIRQLLQRRNQTQPIGLRSCGSVFKNPPGDHAARLIEATGLKGQRQGGAVISTKHANFIINEDNASAEAVRGLITLVQQTVWQRFQVQLQPEVRILSAQSGWCA